MIYKTRTESAELLMLKSLGVRMELPEKDKLHYLSLQKGYDGEVMFDSFTEKLQSECLILNDLLFKINNTVFQIDSLIITAAVIHFYEVKNFEGDYYYESERLYTRSKTEINNPLTQLNRGVSLFRQLLQSLGINMKIDPSVVFINPAFTLYQTPLDKPFIFPTQLNRHLNGIDKTSAKLSTKHKQLAAQLVSLHCTDSPYKQIPSYTFEGLRKGMLCFKCASFSLAVEGHNCVCGECGYVEKVGEAVMRSVKEFRLLFPGEKITTGVIYEWCGIVESKERIRKILGKNYKKVGVRQWSYFE
ncbi:NERD domain-containing protein [Bacillus tianshenii]|uniref:nuclease-related domain-containing protein n=1 Tax=Sutcliffiella tianshenii TaxID=1463404 RepID=UPI001CD814BE|nr:nuclease-related domain-containing protein [Bacillus tianshenii]MCA1320575.1 NERD domain-containing protein [Bacillus tianshenii]